MHGVIIVLLIGVFLAAVIFFAVMGARQLRRANRLARASHDMGMRFSSVDPFDIPRRYAEFALVGGGHSPQAHNVTYGRIEGRLARAFDFRYEIGHGTRRSTRRYSVVTVESDPPMPAVLLWDRSDVEFAPLRARQACGSVGRWALCGDEEFAAGLARACQVALTDEASVETRGSVLMLCRPMRRMEQGNASCIGQALKVLGALRNARRQSAGPACERA